MAFDRSSLRWKLPLLFVLTAAGTVAVFALLAYTNARNTAVEARLDRLHSTLAEITSITGLGAAAQQQMLAAAAADPAILRALRSTPRPPGADAIAVLEKLRGKAAPLVTVELLLPDGHVLAALPGGAAVPGPGNQELPGRDPAVGPLDEDAAGQFFQAAVGVFDGARQVGAIRTTRRLTRGSANLSIVERHLGPDARLVVGNADGRMWGPSGAFAYPLEPSSRGRYDRDGERWLSVSALVGETPWLYAIELPERVALVAARELLWPFIAIGALVALAGGLTGAQIGRRLTRPLEQLTHAAEAVARGDRDVPIVGSARDDEIGRLARAFDQMATQVREVQDRLEAEVDARSEELKQAVGRLRTMHQELRQNERLAMLGRLSGSVGHELRNPLGVMSHVAFLLGELPDASPKLRDYAALLREQIRLSERIISDVLDRARSGAPIRSAVDVGRLIDGLIGRVQIPASIRVERRVPLSLPPLWLDRDQVGQILWNLVTNAVQAMQAGGGILSVDAEICDGRLRIRVRDSGPGVPAEMVDRIFDPLFTTKPQGVGLGLSISRAFARACDGDLRLVPASGPGACFVLDLPAADARQVADAPPKASAS